MPIEVETGQKRIEWYHAGSASYSKISDIFEVGLNCMIE